MIALDINTKRIRALSTTLRKYAEEKDKKAKVRCAAWMG